MAAAPSRVRSWSSALEWLPELAAEADQDEALRELDGRPTVATRLGYILQGLRPDIAQRIDAPATTTWFGPRRQLVRHDNRWLVADTILPFNPRNLPGGAMTVTLTTGWIARHTPQRASRRPGRSDHRHRAGPPATRPA